MSYTDKKKTYIKDLNSNAIRKRISTLSKLIINLVVVDIFCQSLKADLYEDVMRTGLDIRLSSSKDSTCFKTPGKGYLVLATP